MLWPRLELLARIRYEEGRRVRYAPYRFWHPARSAIRRQRSHDYRARYRAPRGRVDPGDRHTSSHGCGCIRSDGGGSSWCPCPSRSPAPSRGNARSPRDTSPRSRYARRHESSGERITGGPGAGGASRPAAARVPLGERNHDRSGTLAQPCRSHPPHSDRRHTGSRRVTAPATRGVLWDSVMRLTRTMPVRTSMPQGMTSRLQPTPEEDGWLPATPSPNSDESTCAPHDRATMRRTTGRPASSVLWARTGWSTGAARDASGVRHQCRGRCRLVRTRRWAPRVPVGRRELTDLGALGGAQSIAIDINDRVRSSGWQTRGPRVHLGRRR